MATPEAPYIPQKTLDELHSSHPEGTRHAAMIKIAMALLGNGFSDQAVFAELRAKFDAEKTDKEIRAVISWCSEKHPTPSGFGAKTNGHPPKKIHYEKKTRPASAPENTDQSADQKVDWYLNGNTTSLEQWKQRSKVYWSGDMSSVAFENLYAPDDNINIVCQFTVSEKGKANPKGGGKTLARDEWVKWFKTKGIPRSEAGAWIRMNPCSDTGTGKGGAIQDCDIQSFRYLLLESDVLSVERQLSLYARLKLPIAALLSSGAKSIHAWIKIAAATSEAYTENVLRILSALKPFGFDQSNKNPSRLSRLPGAKRGIGAVGDGLQQLIYLNPAPEIVLDDEALTRFEISLTVPIPDCKPLKKLARETRARYEDMHANQGKLGVRVGIRDWDRDTGGFKGKQMTVLAAGTGAGKSSMALNLINGALKTGHGVALFTLEMDREEIFDLLLSMNHRINRNLFNTGCFEVDDVERIDQGLAALEDKPLWIYDEAMQTVESIGDRIKALIGQIGLVVIDYVQIVTPDDQCAPREQQVADIAQGFRILAKDTNLPFIILSQVSDDGKLRESRVVGHAAHTVLMLELDDENDEKALLKVVKGRRIPKRKYHLRYEPEYCIIGDEPLTDLPL